ncbi:variably expressed lipoprotein and hemagglutinin (VlhA) family protein [Mycoplasmoides gallisepticum NC06_2006.080-5-2P]|uniref:FIVAR domain-containing protein n=1 Tax=Mycoplasmoides gallisepticum TaxID=2096 RepID=UPI0002778E7D|nr:FIVAR domain-containing protein [Mycoplasmoides gallisepticum]AFP80134.1 variably expressed lipoprotein and hemagglutinin (VlhA) family protein [Mycoplasmoides gallisepticum NC06_2006.080-5-2P]
MKRKNILKFVSLLGIGSFVMLAAASCTSATTPTPNPEPKPTPNPEPNPNPEPKPDPMPNPPSGGTNGGNTNPGNGGGTDNAAHQLAAAKKELSDLLATQNSNLASYADYAKIQNTLTSAYTTAKSTSDNTSATLEQVKSATSTLQTAIDSAASEKKTFDAANPELIKFYNNLKTELQSKTTNLESLNDPQYSGIKDNLNSLYNSASEIVNKTLIPATGNGLMRTDVEKVNTELMGAVNKLSERKTKADNYFNSFDKNVLSQSKLTSASTSQNNNQQPGNYSFVGFSTDVNGFLNTSDNNTPKWNFAQRRVWASENTPLATTPAEDETQQATPLTDVSWIYSLAGTEAKYTLTFDYFGPSTAYLYFPYKLVNTNDKAGLQYKLNNNTEPKLIEFMPAPNGTSAATTSPMTHTSLSTTLVADETMSEKSPMNATPTVSDINIAEVVLSNLNFGSNTIEFSVPNTDGMVAPMIGNMYLTSSNTEVNKNKIYDDIFGNKLAKTNSSTSVTVDLLKGYSLTASYIIYVRQFTNLMKDGQVTPNPVYLVGFIGGSKGRTTRPTPANNNPYPAMNNDSRTYTIYVNAPEKGDYFISGSYISSMTARSLKFSTGETSNTVTVNDLKQDNWNTLGTFDTNTPTDDESGNNKKTLVLQKGLNKIVISGVRDVSSGDTPYIGNLTFTLNTNTQNSENKAPRSQQNEQ